MNSIAAVDVEQLETLAPADHTAQQHGFPIQFVHIRARNNGIPLEQGGVCLAVKERNDGQWNVALAQCPAGKAYDKRLGKTIAATRMRSGKYLVVATLADLQALAESLSAKHSTGTFSVRVDVSHITTARDA